jgi:hypothetical protein
MSQRTLCRGFPFSKNCAGRLNKLLGGAPRSTHSVAFAGCEEEAVEVVAGPKGWRNLLNPSGLFWSTWPSFSIHTASDGMQAVSPALPASYSKNTWRIRHPRPPRVCGGVPDVFQHAQCCFSALCALSTILSPHRWGSR